MSGCVCNPDREREGGRDQSDQVTNTRPYIIHFFPLSPTHLGRYMSIHTFFTCSYISSLYTHPQLSLSHSHSLYLSLSFISFLCKWLGRRFYKKSDCHSVEEKKKNLLKLSFNLLRFLLKMGKSRPLFAYFCPFLITILIMQIVKRWCVWDSNPGPQDGRCRRNHFLLKQTTFYAWILFEKCSTSK